MKRPALLIHSGGFGGRQWRKLAELLAPTHDVLAPDLIGYGSEPWPVGEPFHFRQDVERLAAMLRQHGGTAADGGGRGGQPADVVGHSYGGFLALQLARAAPELVRRIVVYDPVAFNVLTAAERARGFVGVKGEYELPVDEAWLAAFVDWWNGPGAWTKLPETTRAAFRQVGWKMSQEVATLMADRESDYTRIAAPVVVLGGGKSPEAERMTVERLARVVAGAELHMFPDLGHMGPIVDAERVNAAIALSLRR
jgi:pimeloyl-ACP methyl ester carboxylesterase